MVWPVKSPEAFAGFCEAALRWLDSDEVRNGAWIVVGTAFGGWYYKAKEKWLCGLVEQAAELPNVGPPPVRMAEISTLKLPHRVDAIIFVKRLLEWARSLTPKPVEPKSAELPKEPAAAVDLDTQALAVFFADRSRDKTEIARLLRKPKQSLSPDRCPKLDAAMKAWKAPERKPPRGSKSKDRRIEAEDPGDDR
jgi:hypothetical protein